jgi:glycine hydroxymethyltransferase
LILAKSEFGAKLNKEIFPGIQGGPLMHVIAAKAVAFKEAMAESFKTYQKDVVENSKVLASHLTKHGIKLVSGGTDNHMMIADLRNLNITGDIAADVLNSAGITVNKNSIPFEKLSPTVTSGIRIGTPVITTRGMRAPEMQIIARLIVDVLQNHKDDSLIKSVRAKVHEICEAFPIYKNQFQRTG